MRIGCKAQARCHQADNLCPAQNSPVTDTWSPPVEPLFNSNSQIRASVLPLGEHPAMACGVSISLPHLGDEPHRIKRVRDPGFTAVNTHPQRYHKRPQKSSEVQVTMAPSRCPPPHTHTRPALSILPVHRNSFIPDEHSISGLWITLAFRTESPSKSPINDAWPSGEGWPGVHTSCLRRPDKCGRLTKPHSARQGAARNSPGRLAALPREPPLHRSGLQCHLINYKPKPELEWR